MAPKTPTKPSWQRLHGALLPRVTQAKVCSWGNSTNRKSVFYTWMTAPACHNGMLPGNWSPILQKGHLTMLLSAQLPSTARGGSDLPPTAVITADSPSHKPAASPASHDTHVSQTRSSGLLPGHADSEKLSGPEMSLHCFLNHQSHHKGSLRHRGSSDHSQTGVSDTESPFFNVSSQSIQLRLVPTLPVPCPHHNRRSSTVKGSTTSCILIGL